MLVSLVDCKFVTVYFVNILIQVKVFTQLCTAALAIRTVSVLHNALKMMTLISFMAQRLRQVVKKSSLHQIIPSNAQNYTMTTSWQHSPVFGPNQLILLRIIYKTLGFKPPKKKNPAHGRHWIFRRVRLVALIPIKSQKF